MRRTPTYWKLMRRNRSFQAVLLSVALASSAASSVPVRRNHNVASLATVSESPLVRREVAAHVAEAGDDDHRPEEIDALGSHGDDDVSGPLEQEGQVAAFGQRVTQASRSLMNNTSNTSSLNDANGSIVKSAAPLPLPLEASDNASDGSNANTTDDSGTKPSGSSKANSTAVSDKIDNVSPAQKKKKADSDMAAASTQAASSASSPAPAHTSTATQSQVSTAATASSAAPSSTPISSTGGAVGAPSSTESQAWLDNYCKGKDSDFCKHWHSAASRSAQQQTQVVQATNEPALNAALNAGLCKRAVNVSQLTLSVNVENLPTDKFQEGSDLVAKVVDGVKRTIRVEAGHWWLGVSDVNVQIRAGQRSTAIQNADVVMPASSTTLDFVLTTPTLTNAIGLKSALGHSQTLTKQVTAILATSGADSIAQGALTAHAAILNSSSGSHFEFFDCKNKSVFTVLMQVNNVSYPRLRAFDSVLAQFVSVMRKACSSTSPHLVADSDTWSGIQSGPLGATLVNCTLQLPVADATAVFKKFMVNSSGILQETRDVLISSVGNLPAVSEGFITVEDKGVFLSEPSFPAHSTLDVPGYHGHDLGFPHRSDSRSTKTVRLPHDAHGSRGSTTRMSDGSIHHEIVNKDGSVTHTFRHTDGTVHQAVQHPDGTIHHTVTMSDGTVHHAIEHGTGHGDFEHEDHPHGADVHQHDYGADDSRQHLTWSGGASTTELPSKPTTESPTTSTAPSTSSHEADSQRTVNVASSGNRGRPVHVMSTARDDSIADAPADYRANQNYYQDVSLSDFVYLLALGVIGFLVYKHFHPSQPPVAAGEGGAGTVSAPAAVATPPGTAQAGAGAPATGVASAAGTTSAPADTLSAPPPATAPTAPGTQGELQTAEQTGAVAGSAVDGAAPPVAASGVSDGTTSPLVPPSAAEDASPPQAADSWRDA